MEKEGQKFLNPLQTIKSVQQTLNQLKSKIYTLQKEQNRNYQNIEKLFTQAIPIIKKKAHESEQNQNIQKTRLSFNKQERQRSSIARRNRLQQQEQIMNSKAQMSQSKASQSYYIKQISKKNQQVIAEGRRRVLQEKRMKRNFIKQSEQKSRTKVHQFHLYKKYMYKKQKQFEENLMLKKIEEKQKIIKDLCKKEQQIAERTQKSKHIYGHLKDTLEYLSKVKAQKFRQITQKINLEENKQLDDKQIQKILYQIDNQIQPQIQPRHSLHQPQVSRKTVTKKHHALNLSNSNIKKVR